MRYEKFNCETFGRYEEPDAMDGGGGEARKAAAAERRRNVLSTGRRCFPYVSDTRLGTSLESWFDSRQDVLT